MSLPSDKYIREQIGTLDHISPPTNWNPDNTWRRIAKTKLWYRRKTAVVLGLLPILLLMAFFFWPTAPVQISTIYLSEISVSGHINQSSSLPSSSQVVMVEELHESFDDQQVAVLQSLIKNELSTETALHQPPSHKKENALVNASISDIDSSRASHLVQETEEDTVHSRALDVSTTKTQNTSPIISISLHSDKEKTAPKKVHRSIIKLKSDYRYSTSKKTYSLQINK